MIERHQARRYENLIPRQVDDALTVEAPLEIRVNGEPFTVTMRTPGQDAALARGIIHTEGLLARGTEVVLEEVPATKDQPARVDVTADPASIQRDFSRERSVLSTSSCGLCGKRDFSSAELGDCPIRFPVGAPLDPARVPYMLQQLERGQLDFEQSGGCHAAALYDGEGVMLALAEDVGRHNAVDKAVGMLLLRGAISEAQALVVSGRVSYEIVYKSWRAGVAQVLAVSAPSSLAVATARRLGMTLCGFCRGNRLTVYTSPDHPEGTTS